MAASNIIRSDVHVHGFVFMRKLGIKKKKKGHEAAQQAIAQMSAKAPYLGYGFLDRGPGCTDVGRRGESYTPRRAAGTSGTQS